MSASSRRSARDGAPGLRVVFPDLTPALRPLASLLGAAPRDPSPRDPVMPPARWAEMRQVGTGLPRGWRRLPASTLWAAHSAAFAAWLSGAARPGTPSLLSLSRHLAHLVSSPCHLCALHCGARRDLGERGPCGSGSETRIDRVLLLDGEEAFLGRGLAIFPAGCNVRPGCRYCLYPWAISAQAGAAISPGSLARRIEGAAAGAVHTHWIGGNMDQHLPYLFDALSACRAPLPVVYHTNGTSSPEAMSLVGAVASVISVDCRHGSDACAAEFGAEVLRFRTVQATIRRAVATGAVVVVRVLALPGRHLHCCTRPVLEFLSGDLRERVWVNLLGHQYTPCHRALHDPEIGRPLHAAERRTVDAWVAELGLRRLDAPQMSPP